MQFVGRDIFVLYLLFLFVNSAWAGQHEIYVYNRPFNGKIVYQKNTIYVSLLAITQSMGLKIEKKEKENVMWIGSMPDLPASCAFFVNGDLFTYTIVGKNGEYYVSLKEFVEATGNEIRINEDTQIIDINRSSRAIPSISNKGKEQISMRQVLMRFQDLKNSIFATRGDIREYLDNLLILSDEHINWTSELEAKFLYYKTFDKDIRKALRDLSKTLEDFTRHLNERKEAVNKVTIPPEFVKSHKFLVSYINRVYPEYSSLALQFSILLASALKADSTSQIDQILARLKTILNRLLEIEVQTKYEEKIYLSVFESELKKIKMDSSPVRT